MLFCWQVLAFFEGDGDEGLQAFVEPFVIMLILVINAVVGVWQEHNAENALDALKEMQTTTTKVLRNGVLVPDVPSSELVPGDVVDVRVGDKVRRPPRLAPAPLRALRPLRRSVQVPADVRIIKLKTTTIKTDEGSLTGESETVLKQLEVVEKDVRAPSPALARANPGRPRSLSRVSGLTRTHPNLNSGRCASKASST